jgi:hypothetical protein
MWLSSDSPRKRFYSQRPSTVQVKKTLRLIIYALRDEDVWGSGNIDPVLASTLDGGERLASRSCRFTPGKGPPTPVG